MDRQTAIWRGGQDRQQWLSMLIDAMEEAARPDVRAQPCAPAIVASVRAQLAQPVSHYPHTSAFSLKN
jgi:hypothetical protein